MTELKWIEGERAVVQSSEDKTLRVWDLRSCCVAQQLKPKQHVQVVQYVCTYVCTVCIYVHVQTALGTYYVSYNIDECLLSAYVSTLYIVYECVHKCRLVLVVVCA